MTSSAINTVCARVAERSASPGAGGGSVGVRLGALAALACCGFFVVLMFHHLLSVGRLLITSFYHD